MTKTSALPADAVARREVLGNTDIKSDAHNFVDTASQTKSAQRNSIPIELNGLGAAKTSSGLRKERFLTDIADDLSGQNRAEDRISRTERLATIGQMMTVLTHESRNLLQLCQTNLEMLETEIADRPRALVFAARIQKAQDNLARLHEEMRQFAAPIQLEREPFHLGYLAGQVLNDLSSMHQGRQIRLRETSDGVDLRCVVDPFRMHQVFRNIMENSIAACCDPVGLSVVWSESELHGMPALEVALRDNGPGLSAEQKRRVFEPFFTTKKSGTGLGLVISRRIVEAHGGRIAVGNNGHKGAEFVITLPRQATLPHS